MKRRMISLASEACAMAVGLFFYLLFPSATFADSSIIPDNGIAPYTVELTATVQSSPPSITLSWPSEASSTNYYVYRKSVTATSWGSMATLAGDITSYTDNAVATGTTYEYEVVKATVGVPGHSGILSGYGYVYSGIQAPLEDTRGTIILIVDDSKSTPLSTELARLEQDLSGDGWTVIRHDVASTSSVVSVKALITADYQADPTNVKQVFLFGRVPVPYSGDINPDGHPNHLGAWPADIYYGNMTGTSWTDTTIWTDTTMNDSGASDSRNWNIPGDGKFDQNIILSPENLAVGRVDLSNMPAFAPNTETDLLRQYLNKDHQYRIKGTVQPLNQGLVSANFGAISGEAFGGSGWMNLSVLVGGSNIISTTLPGALSYFAEATSTSFLWAEGDGGGTYTSAGGIGNTTNFASTSPHAVFNMLFGSYFGDWDNQNNFLRAPLASSGWGLTDVWSGRPWWIFDHMGLGETIGYDVLTNENNQNNMNLYWDNFGSGYVSMALMGDPTLHMNPMTPPGNLTSSSTERITDLTWTASPDNGVIGYHIYRSTSQYGLYTRLTSAPVSGTTYEDSATTSASYYYMVRAVRLETTPSGSYWNASEGTTTGPIAITVINTPPTISTISAAGGNINSTTTVPFTVGDAESGPNPLILSATSSDTSLISASGLSFGGSDASRTLLIHPAQDKVGFTTVSITVFDGQYYATSTFVFTVNAIPDTTPPSIPTNLSASVLSPTSISLSWASSTDSGTGVGLSSGLAGYLIYRNGVNMATTTSLSYVDTGLSAATGYLYGVAAFDGAGNVSQSTSTGATTASNPTYGGGSVSPPSVLAAILVPSATSTVVLNALPNAISGCPAGFTCVPASTTPSLSEASTFAADLSPGDTGQGVLALQEYLNEHGFPVASSGAGSSGHETTTFGPATKAALKAFQKAHNITPTGNLGPLTRALINKDSKIPAAPAFPRDLSVDSSGPDVKVLQMFLNNLGYIIAANGAGSPGQETTFFGTKTAAALSLFQDDHSLSSDTGVLSGTTRSLINQLYSQKQ